MEEDEVRALAQSVLEPILAPFGFVATDAEAKPDHDGDASLFITVHFKPGADVAPGETYEAARAAMRDALMAQGDDRYPYLDWDYPEFDPAQLDEDEGGPGFEA